MSNGIELATTHIIAYGPSNTVFGNNADWETNYISYPPHVLQALRIRESAKNLTLNGPAVWAAVQTCNSLTTMEEVFRGLSSQNAAQVAFQLKLHCLVQAYTFTHHRAARHSSPYFIGNGNGSAAGGFYGAMQSDNKLIVRPGPIPSNGVDFYGTPIMPVAAIGYWVYGGGVDRHVHIGSLNLQMVMADFKPITTVLNSNGPGTFPVSSDFSYNVFDKNPINLPAAGMLGRVSGHVDGTLIINADNSYTFNGQYSLNPDLYDAGSSNRTPVQEGLTSFLRMLGETLGHTDYTINIIGTQQLAFSGSK